MGTAESNWELLVWKTLEREQLRISRQEIREEVYGFASAVPPSLQKRTKIESILEIAHKIEDINPNKDPKENVNLARILCDQAYLMSQSLDPNCKGRGILQFKTGLMSLIAQKLCKNEGVKIDRSRDMDFMLNFYRLYRKSHGVDDIQKEERIWKECGAFSGKIEEGKDICSTCFKLELRYLKMRRVHTTLRAILEVMEALPKDSTSGVAGQKIHEELRKINPSGASTTDNHMPFNIVPLDASSMTNAVGLLPEVKAAISAIRYPTDFPQLPQLPRSVEDSQPHHLDVFDLLQYVFGFQEGNISNQRENLVLSLANAQSRCVIPVEVEPRIDEAVITQVFTKVMDNYIKWCKYLCIQLAWTSSENINREKKVTFISLYYLIWGEAANVRFLPECICYIFHNMAKELDVILNQRLQPAKSCTSEQGTVSFLDKIICPLYKAIQKEAEVNREGKAAHSLWRNYDDFNEYFWSPTCFKLSWPMETESSFFKGPTNQRGAKKCGFVEHRTFLHLYRSFHRLWIFLVMMFQGLAIIAFNGTIDMNTFKQLLSVGPTFAVMSLVESLLNVMLTFGAYTTAGVFAITMHCIRTFWLTCCSVFISFLYLKVVRDKTQRPLDSFYFRIYILVLGVYAALRLFLAVLLKFPACHTLLQKCDWCSFSQFFKWIYQDQHYVGHGLYERTSDYIRYMSFWLVIFGCKFSFTYFLQIKPLVKPTQEIVNLSGLHYAWPDLVSRNNHNALTIASLWGPVVAIYLLDLHIWYTLLSALVGGIIGVLARLGEIHAIEMIQNRFESFPEAFVKNLVSSRSLRIQPDRLSQGSIEMRKVDAAKFSPFWNEIIKSLHEEDHISNLELDLLRMPSNHGSLSMVQWPLFLLCSKMSLAVDLAVDCKDTQTELWTRVAKDDYMAYAVQECYYTVKNILLSLAVEEGYDWVQRLYDEINQGILGRAVLVNLRLKNLPLVVLKLTKLTEELTKNETLAAERVARALYELYEVVTRDLLSDSLREQLETWNILVKVREEARCLFSRINRPDNPETGGFEQKELAKRVHLLLTVKDSAENVPRNLEARRRLQFFTNSLFMDMPPAKPVSEMVPFSVFTPYYKETVLYSCHDLHKENEDGISILFYLQTIYPDEWRNFLQRIGHEGSTKDTDLLENPSDLLELRLWASYRGQTLARTVRGMMYYRRALLLQSYLEDRTSAEIEDGHSRPDFTRTQGYESSREACAQADLKFTYVVSCQVYGQQKQQKTPEAADIALLLRRNKALRVAFIHQEKNGSSDGRNLGDHSKLVGADIYYSKLVKADIDGKDQEIYSIQLPGNPMLGEGKPENQNHAIIFTRGDAIQTIDMNQENYLEEGMKMRNLLEEFHGNHGLRNPTILGVREHIFTGSVSSLALIMSNQETSFVTLAQRVLAYPLKVRMHYGHPDVFDRIFHLSRGGISKASRVINISEDIYAGFNSTLRQGNVTHHEYIQVGKGRDVGFNQIAQFEGKVAGGNGEQVLSRDIYRLGQHLDFFRMTSFYFTTVGFYVCTMMTVLTIYIFLYGRVYLALSGLDRAISGRAKVSGNTAFDAALNAQFLVQIGIFTAVPMIIGFVLELGLVKAVIDFIVMQLQFASVFFTFSLGTKTHFFGQTILHGGAKYRPTGRGFVVQHIKFDENYRLYSRSHFVKAFEIALLLMIYIAYGYTKGGARSFALITISSWFLVVSWLFAPYFFNPCGFEWQKTVDDFDDWTSWLLYKGGVGLKDDRSWETWWEEGQKHIHTMRGRLLETLLTLRFFMLQYGVVYHLAATKKYTGKITVYALSWLVLVVFVLILKLFIFSVNRKRSAEFKLGVRTVQGATFIAIVTIIVFSIAGTPLTVTDLFASLLGFIPSGWAVLCLCITWKRYIKALGLWDSVREVARFYDALMGLIIFLPVATLSWFPFTSTFQSRLLFNQAFSRGLEMSLILVGNKANVQI